jgi:pSer/pThr/pTyr-binding forkhead associated (FHA) protein
MTDSPGLSAEPDYAATATVVLPIELTILDHYARQSSSLLPSLPAIVGRAEKDDVQLNDPWISHSHCELFQQGGVVVVRDLDSKNGVFLHGVRVREAEVLSGECLTLGRTEVTFRYRRTNPDLASTSDLVADSKVSLPVARRPAGGPMTEELLY